MGFSPPIGLVVCLRFQTCRNPRCMWTEMLGCLDLNMRWSEMGCGSTCHDLSSSHQFWSIQTGLEVQNVWGWYSRNMLFTLESTWRLKKNIRSGVSTTAQNDGHGLCWHFLVPWAPRVGPSGMLLGRSVLDPKCSNEKKGLPWLFEGILIGDELLPGLCRELFHKPWQKSYSVIFNKLRMSHGFRIIRVFFFHVAQNVEAALQSLQHNQLRCWIFS